MRKLNRRFLLKSFGAFAVPPTLAPFAFFVSTQKSQAGWAAGIATALQVAAFATSLKQRSGGLGKVIESIQLKLDQLIDNDIEILKSIQVLSQQIDTLPDEIRNDSTLNQYRTTYKDVLEGYNGIVRKSKHIELTGAEDLTSKDFDELTFFVERFVGKTDRLIGDLEFPISGEQGVFAVCHTVSMSYLFLSGMIRAAKILNYMPNHIKRASWHSSVEYESFAYNIKHKIFPKIVNTLVPALNQELQHRSEVALQSIKANIWYSNIEEYIDPEKADLTLPQSKQVCIKTPYRDVEMKIGKEDDTYTEERVDRQNSDVVFPPKRIPGKDINHPFSLTYTETWQFEILRQVTNETRIPTLSISGGKDSGGPYVDPADRDQLKKLENNPYGSGQTYDNSMYIDCKEIPFSQTNNEQMSRQVALTALTQLHGPLENYSQAEWYKSALVGITSTIQNNMLPSLELLIKEVRESTKVKVKYNRASPAPK